MAPSLSVSRTLTEYQSAHNDFLRKRSTAVVFSVLFAVGAVPLFVIAIFRDLTVLLNATPIALVIGVSAFWGYALAAKIRLETIKGILEQEEYVIGRTVEDDTVKILATDEQLDLRIFDDAFVKSLKTSEGWSSALPRDLFLMAPRGRITKHYVQLFSA